MSETFASTLHSTSDTMNAVMWDVGALREEGMAEQKAPTNGRLHQFRSR
jgi:hypothetical protein